MIPNEVISAWHLIDVRPLSGGLINQTYRASINSTPVILQKLNPIFKPEIHYNIQAVCKHATSNSALTFAELVPNINGQLWTEVQDQVWRVQTHIAGDTLHGNISRKASESAGMLVGRFHESLTNFSWTYQAPRAAHDTQSYLNKLRAIAKEKEQDESWRALAAGVLELSVDMPDLWKFPLRHCHGDLKISNLLFKGDNAVALIDLDTLGALPIAYDFGDALRSWGNTSTEDAPPQLCLETCDAALKGYLNEVEGSFGNDEFLSIADGLWVIATELAARFAIDYVEDYYFGWDSNKFPSRKAHNMVRAQGQLQLAKSARASVDHLKSTIESCL